MTIQVKTELTKKIKVLVAANRVARPHTHGKAKCPFDAGNEAMTPPSSLEIVTLEKGKDKWQIRVMENKFPFLSPREKFEKNKNTTGGFGCHEVIVETPNHDELFENLNETQLTLLFEAYVNRFNAISEKKGVEYTFLFKNHGKEGGASINHEHSQIVGLPFIPEIPACEFKMHSEKKCSYCSLARENVVFQNSEFAVVRPSFARFELECWVIPKKHIYNFIQFNEKTALAFMETLQETVKRIKRKTENYNIVFHASCKNKKIHFHAEVYPRTSVYAGLELGTGIIANIMDDKTALKILK
ncbi:MAG: DUF4931 domain-containing protein [Candidatus Micrarchaeota archaeon]